MSQLVVGSTNLIELTGLQDQTDGSYPATATVTCDLSTAAGVAVSGATGLAMPFVVGTSGAASTYRGVITSAVALALYATYLATVTVVDANGNRRVFTCTCLAIAG